MIMCILVFVLLLVVIFCRSFFFFNDTATTEIYTYWHTLSLHDALPISATLPSPSTAMVASMSACSRWMRTTTTVMPDCSETTGSSRPVSAPAAASCACTAASLSTPRASFICAVKSAVAASYSPACMWSSRRVAVATASASPSAAIAGIAAGRQNSRTSSNDCRIRISVLPLEEHAQGIGVVRLLDRDQFPALRAELVQLGLRALGELATEHLVRQFDDLVLPARAHGWFPFRSDEHT